MTFAGVGDAIANFQRLACSGILVEDGALDVDACFERHGGIAALLRQLFEVGIDDPPSINPVVNIIPRWRELIVGRELVFELSSPPASTVIKVQPFSRAEL